MFFTTHAFLLFSASRVTAGYDGAPWLAAWPYLSTVRAQQSLLTCSLCNGGGRGHLTGREKAAKCAAGRAL